MTLVGFKSQNHRQQVAKRGPNPDVDDRQTTDDDFDPAIGPTSGPPSGAAFSSGLSPFSPIVSRCSCPRLATEGKRGRAWASGTADLEGRRFSVRELGF